MRNFALLLLFTVPMTLQPGFCQNSIVLQGAVYGNDGFPLSETHVVDIDSREGTITGTQGAFSLSIPDSGAVLRISHVGFHPLLHRVTREQVERATSQRLNITLDRASTLLSAAEVTARDDISLIGQLGTVLFDFSFAGDNMLLLVAHNGKRMLRLTDGQANPIMELPVARKGELLYDDCLGNVHLFGKDSVYQIGLSGDSIWLAHTSATDYFLDKMGHCATASDSHIFFSAYQKAGQEVNHYGFHRETHKGVILAKVLDKEQIARAEEYFSRVSTPKYRWVRFSSSRYRPGDVNDNGHCIGISRMASPHCSSPADGGRAERGGGGSLNRSVRRSFVARPPFRSMEGYERSFPAHLFELEQQADGVWDPQPYERIWRKMMAPPTYSPMFSLRDSIYVFDHVLGLCEVFNRAGEQIRTFPIVHQGMREWKRKLIPDADGQRIYARMERNSTLYLAEIDLNDGSVLSTIRLPDAAHSDRLRVRQGHAYFMVRDTDLYTPDRLVRQRL